MKDGKPLEPLFDTSKARATIERGRRARWWIRKKKSGNSYNYFDVDGRSIKGITDLERIKDLVIPPAWKFVRVNPSPGGKIQAVGMDTTGRVQYLYHPLFAAKRQRKKFEKIERFGTVLPQLRRVTKVE